MRRKIECSHGGRKKEDLEEEGICVVDWSFVKPELHFRPYYTLLSGVSSPFHHSIVGRNV